MNKTTAILVAGACAALSLPALAVADKPESNPHKPPSNHASTPSAGNRANTPAAQCRAERTAMDEANFKSTYGTNADKSNAFGRCVSHQSRHTTAGQQQARVKASAKCRAERRSDPAAFKAKYGTNRNKSNAFGKCVSKTARAGG